MRPPLTKKMSEVLMVVYKRIYEREPYVRRLLSGGADRGEATYDSSRSTGADSKPGNAHRSVTDRRRSSPQSVSLSIRFSRRQRVLLQECLMFRWKESAVRQFRCTMSILLGTILYGAVGGSAVSQNSVTDLYTFLPSAVAGPWAVGTEHALSAGGHKSGDSVAAS
jgi:hypothetical protein